MKIAKEGGELVRLTVQGRFEADACMKIRESLWEKGCDVPLVADIHFAPAVAMRVADAFEKVGGWAVDHNDDDDDSDDDDDDD